AGPDGGGGAALRRGVLVGRLRARGAGRAPAGGGGDRGGYTIHGRTRPAAERAAGAASPQGGAPLSPENDYTTEGTSRPRRVREVLEARRGSLLLEVLTPEAPLDRLVADPDISSPGLALAGFTDRFAGGRLQVF